MRTTAWRRWGARLLLSLFAQFWGESVVLQSCPMHQGSREHAANAAGSTEHSKGPATPSPCSCLGNCMGTTPIALTGPAAEVPVAVVVWDDDVADAQTPQATGESQLRLPFAQGPPPNVA